MVKKVAIFGGSGTTGKCVVEYALEKGKELNAILENVII